ncbi:UrcA family protein [Altererythrobacter sp. B11]|uniref:UrcA family protein n=1 Tax=Altererythrobacter sp. B11 TaxID=2060312 RepID=UPI000DC6E941|nr:UrcA family protein [Altererythrobacter sp. B11]
MIKNGLIAIAGCALVASVPAAAENPYAKEEAVLHLSGLDLTTVEGQQRLAIRMDEAARAVCGDRLSSVHLELGAKSRECRAAVLADIRSQIESRVALADKAPATQLAYNR